MKRSPMTVASAIDLCHKLGIGVGHVRRAGNLFSADARLLEQHGDMVLTWRASAPTPFEAVMNVIELAVCDIVD